MKRVKPRLSAESGFTLIEVLIGVSIFAIGLLGIASLQLHSVRNTTIGDVTSQATMLANQKMEVVKTTAFADLTNEVENNLDPDGNAGGIYNRTTTIIVPAAPLDAYMRQVRVQVQWDTSHGGNRSVEVNSLTYERW